MPRACAWARELFWVFFLLPRATDVTMNLDLELIREMVAALPDPVFVLTASGRYAALVGGSDPEFYHDGSHLVGLSLHQVLPQDKADWFLAQIRHSLQTNRLHTVEYGLGGTDVEGLDPEQGPSGEIWFEGRIQPLSGLIEGERAVVWVARNITRRHELETELRRMSELDELTGAYNRRRLFNDLAYRTSEFQRYGQPVALLMLDIDHFKRCNDLYGHLVGDKVLHQLAANCMRQLRKVDTFYRFGGEEFAALLPHSDETEAYRLAERLRQYIAQHSIDLEKEHLPVTISIGVSQVMAADSSFEEVIKRADAALYEAKRSGRNRVVLASAAKGGNTG